MKADCKGRGSAPSSHHLSPSLLEKIQHQEMMQTDNCFIIMWNMIVQLQNRHLLSEGERNKKSNKVSFLCNNV